MRDAITNAYRMDETVCLNQLLATISFSATEQAHIAEIAHKLVVSAREYKKHQGKVEGLLQQYDLSTEEGIALMCLAEALLRIPDKATQDKFISDKLSSVDWSNQLNKNNPLFANMATWSLMLTGKVYSPTLETKKSWFGALKKTGSQLSAALIRPLIIKMITTVGQQFVMGEDIHSALKRAQAFEAQGYRFSYDMLGEAARTEEDAERYYAAYVMAIDAIGQIAKQGDVASNPGISVKLSALHPRYDYLKHDEVVKAVVPRLLALAEQAKKYNIGLTVDAEEADRLMLSLDIIEAVFIAPSLAGWNGFGLAVQAYQKRAPWVIDWLANLAEQHRKRWMVRLVKGAYWDSEIKNSQIQGFSGYPVFTRKNATDVSYLACAKKLLARPDCFYPQFGTHNAYTVAAILEMGKDQPFEFQALHGMGQALYDQVVAAAPFNRPCRIYAPVGTQVDLLSYLVRRLLENGANSSFVNHLANENYPIAELIADPVARMAALSSKPHPRIPLPKNVYGAWENSQGIDLSNAHEQADLFIRLDEAMEQPWMAGPIVNGQLWVDKTAQPVHSPGELNRLIGYVNKADTDLLEEALTAAKAAEKSWAAVSVDERAAILERAAELFQQNMPTLIAMLNQEGGKCIPDAIAEVRETIDYCRYYAYRARVDLKTVVLPGPTGELNELSMHPRGTMACISPWNFPLAIFSGQVLAALVTGNCVIAKPADQTAIVACKAVQILHQAGIPAAVLQFVNGKGSTVGAKLTSDERIAGVIFTGSTETAKFIERALANRNGPIGVLIAETGGQNAMIVDSTALPEQVVADVAQSAFNSAGQRCSALRVLFLQEDIAPKVLPMLKGYLATYQIGQPSHLDTDVGPIIDQGSKEKLEAHYRRMQQEATLIAEVPMTANNGYYFAPCAFEIKDLSVLTEEIFGPILHIIRYRSQDLEQVINAVIKTGYGLTLGIHSRIQATIQQVIDQMPVGNMYVNRNMIGAVVGVQPFGGERLSGTGPKAGGPHYLTRLCVERTVSVNTAAVGGNTALVSLSEDD